jgi:ubiquinone/menaquinone biosynthesis C-methylase UbiE
MNWHGRYLQQAGWTRNLRDYVFQRCNLARARRVLEVGCGTGAVLKDLPADGPQLHGLDVSVPSLRICQQHLPSARLACGDARALPYPDGSCDITFCHYLLLWIPDPVHALLEMKRVTAPGGYVVAFAEPDYGAREDQPAELAWLGQRQNEALARQGANIRSGSELAGLFEQAGIPLTETAKIRSPRVGTASDADWENEWQVLETDLRGDVSPEDLAAIKDADRRARALGRHVLNVPTYFAWGQV